MMGGGLCKGLPAVTCEFVVSFRAWDYHGLVASRFKRIQSDAFGLGLLLKLTAHFRTAVAVLAWWSVTVWCADTNTLSHSLSHTHSLSLSRSLSFPSKLVNVVP